MKLPGGGWREILLEMQIPSFPGPISRDSDLVGLGAVSKNLHFNKSSNFDEGGLGTT